MEKQASISADEPCLHGCAHCIFAGVRQFGFRSSIDPDRMGIDFADGTCPHLLETKAADEKLLDMAKQLSERYLISEVMELPEQAEDQVYYQILKMAGKSMLEQIGEVERERLEYKEYIEQWIHEIKTPITAMKLLCENHRTNWTKELLLELEKTNRFTEQALYYARSEHTEKDYSVREMALSQVVHQAIADNKYLLLQSGMRLEVEEMQDTVYSDEKWVRFILNQLIVNAVKYRTKQPVLRISTHKWQDQVVLVVEDNGIGIAASDLPRIFEKGFTGQNGRLIQQSTGIGLYLCKRLCEKLGIGITAESSEHGTAISLSFHINCLIHEVQN
ncbi:MAG: sensor histidine kinase [Subdoligranulum sp.]